MRVKAPFSYYGRPIKKALLKSVVENNAILVLNWFNQPTAKKQLIKRFRVMFSLRAERQTSDSKTVKNNRPFPSCTKPLFQSEAKCEAIEKKMIFLLSCYKNSFS